MAINSNKTNTTAEQTKKEWKRILVPHSKLTYIHNAENGKVSFAFAIAEHDNITFMVSSKLVRVNNDRTGFIVSLPVPGKGEEIKLSESIAPSQPDGQWTRKELSAESIQDLGYPFAE